VGAYLSPLTGQGANAAGRYSQRWCNGNTLNAIFSSTSARIILEIVTRLLIERWTFDSSLLHLALLDQRLVSRLSICPIRVRVPYRALRGAIQTVRYFLAMEVNGVRLSGTALGGSSDQGYLAFSFPWSTNTSTTKPSGGANWAKARRHGYQDRIGHDASCKAALARKCGIVAVPPPSKRMTRVQFPPLALGGSSGSGYYALLRKPTPGSTARPPQHSEAGRKWWVTPTQSWVHRRS
jgi:hypothetical protein